MTPEEYIKSKTCTIKSDDFILEGPLYHKASKDVVEVSDAYTAIRMARNENKNSTVGMQGWICPKCGRVYSPYTSMCKFCANDAKINAQCVAQSEIGMSAESEYPINSKFNK